MDNSSQNKIYIVLADDEPRIHEMIREVLENARMVSRFESFYEPFSFLEFLKKNSGPPDLVLLDVHFKNSGLSGIEIIPFIREDYPYVPIILLTGMEGEEIDRAQDYELIYYIPKPVSSENLVRMVRFYLGMGRRSGQRTAEISLDLARHKELVQALKIELAQAEIDSWDGEKEAHKPGETKGFQRIMEILHTVLKNCDLAPGIMGDLEKLFDADFPLFKKSVDTIVQFDIADVASPGMHVHKYHIVDYVYSLRVTQKARLLFYQPPHLIKKRLIRLDPEHDDKKMDKWLKANHETFAGP
ncbi:MAG: response regulator [Pseudomonadota bacterium]